MHGGGTDQWTHGRVGQDRTVEPINRVAAPLYASHFNLKCRPFSLLPDPAFLFWSPVHRRAYAMLEYGLSSATPIIVITGEIGAGKTTLLRHLLRSASPDLTIATLSNLVPERGSLLNWVLLALGQTSTHRDLVRLSTKLDAFLRSEFAQGRRVVLVIDEAQNLSRAQLEELRCLTNLNTPDAELLQIILVGQPELDTMITSNAMRQFAQRVGSRFHLEGLSARETPDYIAHRLTVAGADRDVFTADACALIHAKSGGLPRIINQLCDYGLVYAFAEGSPVVDLNHIELVLDDRQVLSSLPGGEPLPRQDPVQGVPS